MLTTDAAIDRAFQTVPILYTVQRATSRSGGTITLDCFAARHPIPGVTPALTKITGLVAEIIGHRAGLKGLRVENLPRAGEYIAAALSDALDITIAHERI